MTGSRKRLSPKVVEVLRNADRAIRNAIPGDHRKFYNQWRVTMGTIAPVDSFYVAFYRDDRHLVVPYMYDEREYDPPSFQLYGPRGLSAWMRENAKPYLYSMDKGRLLHMGHSFGNKERISRDAIVIPLLGSSSDGSVVVGLASMQAYSADVYDDLTVRAFQWLAQSVMTALVRDDEESINQELLGATGGPSSISPLSITEVIDEFGFKLAGLRAKLIDILQVGPAGHDAVMNSLGELLELLERAQVETVELLMAPSADASSLLERLTPRERQIAELIADGHTNEQIATELTISELTVKTHVTRILKKFGVRQRAAVKAKLRPFQ